MKNSPNKTMIMCVRIYILICSGLATHQTGATSEMKGEHNHVIMLDFACYATTYARNPVNIFYVLPVYMRLLMQAIYHYMLKEML